MKLPKLIKIILPPLVLLPLLAYLVPFVQAQVFPGPERRNMAVSAIVPPSANDFQFKLDYQGSSLVSQDQTITYEITYGASSSAGLATNNVITVNYSADKAPDGSYLTDYVFGSASRGYGDVQPVVDTKLRTITWTLAPLQEGTLDQKLTFQLRANGNRHDLKRLTFRSNTTLRNEYVTLPSYGVQQDYLFDPARVTPGPTATPLPPSTPTPTPIPVPLFYRDISIAELTATSAAISITTSNPTRTSIQYGTSPGALTQQVENNQLLRFKTLQLTNLKPNTRYYMQVTARDKDNVRLRSENVTFVTPASTQQLLTGSDAYTFTSGDVVLLSNVLTDAASGFFLLPSGTEYTLSYAFTDTPPDGTMEAIVRNDQNILQRVAMKKLNPKTYTADLTAYTPGTYSISVVQTDSLGNVKTRTLATMKISSPIRVFEAGSSFPISDATVRLLAYNAQTKRFEDYTSRSITNPARTNSSGEVRYLLPNGTYRIDVTALGHRAKSVQFTIGPEANSGYPTVYLERDLLSLPTLFDLVRTTLLEIYLFILDRIQTIAGSMRAFATTAVISLTSLITLSYLLFSIRTDIRWRDLMPFFIFHLAVLQHSHREKFLYGTVLDATGNPLSNVRLELLHLKTEEVLAHTITNKAGNFKLPNAFDAEYVKLVASADGLPAVTEVVPTDSKKSIQLTMDTKTHEKNTPALALVSHLSSGMFEIVLITTLVLELLFIEAFGVARTLPFIALTFLNLALWIFYQREKGTHRV